MGTSNSFGGPGNNTPLIPSWLGGDESNADSNGQNSNNGDNSQPNQDSGQNPIQNNPQQPIPQARPGRFRTSRSNFTRFVNSGGTDRSALGRSISSYISTSSGGARTAAKRIGASKRVAAGITNFLNTARTDGVAAALRSRNLNDLIGKPIDEIFSGLLEDICPDGGNIDEGLARSAFVETIGQLVEDGVNTLDNLSIEQLQYVVEVFVTNTIEGRLYNDIGTKIVVESADVEAVEQIQSQVHDFIRGSVSDAIARHAAEFNNLGGLDTNALIDTIYVESYEILKTLSENEQQL